MGIEGYYEDYFDDRQDDKIKNYEKIKNMSLDEMAEFHKGLLNSILKRIEKDLNKEFNAKDFISLSKYKKSFIKQWLQEESEEKLPK